MTEIKKTNILHQLLYYIILVFSGYVIYHFQIEKSFNLLSVYISIILLLLTRIFFEKFTKYLLPLFFVGILYYLYPGIKFIYIASGIALILGILLPKYSIRIKIGIISVVGFLLTFIYVIPNDLFAQIKYLPFILGSLFMFRAISYIHEMRYAKSETPLIEKINYFLLLPNLSMPLFPIVDFKNFVSSYTTLNFRQLKRGTLFICRGIIQLLIYRAIYHHGIRSFKDIFSIADVFIYISCNFLIVLRVIGAYHISIGLITLTGYNVPDLFNNIFFSTGFSDLWRRTNMYWKNFVIKIFYYPIYFKVKKRGEYFAIIFTTITCFFITWLLHNYQWFWLKGSFPIVLKDLIFWGTFGILVSISSVSQQNKLHQNEQKKITPSKFQILFLSIKGLWVFISMSLLWSIWIAPDLNSWKMLMIHAKNIDIHSITTIIYLSISYLIISWTYHYYQKNKNHTHLLIAQNLESISVSGYLIIILSLLIIQLSIGNNLKFNHFFNPILHEQLNKADQENVDNGYYSNLINTNDYCTQVWTNETNINKRRTKYINQNATILTKDMLLCKYIPNKKIALDNIQFSINSDGFHDKEYAKTKPNNTYRIVVLGGSYESGNGVNDDEDFISIVENNLNKNYEITKDGQNVKIEIINLSVNGYMLLQRMYQYKYNVKNYHPDAVLLFLHTNYNQRIVNYVSRLVYNECSIEDPYLASIIKLKNITKADNDASIKTKLGTYADSLNLYAIKSIANMAKQDSINLISVFLPALKDKKNGSDLSIFEAYGKQLNFPIISLQGVYDGQSKKELSISEIDFHPNKKGNDIIAKKLEESIILQHPIFGLNIITK